MKAKTHVAKKLFAALACTDESFSDELDLYITFLKFGLDFQVGKYIRQQNKAKVDNLILH